VRIHLIQFEAAQHDFFAKTSVCAISIALYGKTKPQQPNLCRSGDGRARWMCHKAAAAAAQTDTVQTRAALHLE
jgi:hypothetical protein